VSEPTLLRALEVLKAHPEIRVLISGHTDSRGAYEHNLDLSRRRAESVKQWLVDNGIDAGRLETRGAGPDEPIESNATSSGRFANRRIEFEVLDEAPKGR
jgi:OOP family OmpA-OmpF porin